MSVNQRTSDGNPVILMFIIAFVWTRAFTDGKFSQFCRFVAVPASEILERTLLLICSLSVHVFHQWGCHAEKIKLNCWQFWLGFNEQMRFDGMAFCMPSVMASSFSNLSYSY